MRPVFVKIVFAATALGAAAGILALLPGPSALQRAPFSLVIEDRSGILLGARVAEDGQWRFPLTARVPEKLAKAIITQEDRRFYWHPGVDIIALSRALSVNVRRHKVVSGGSTLTMQVIRLSRKGRPRTIKEKIVESILALRLQLLKSKSTVLAMYAAHAPFGGNVVGIEAASWRYFNRPPSMLSWAEAATLAVLPNEPGLVHLGQNRVRLQQKRDRLLQALLVRHEIDSVACRLAVAEPLAPCLHALPRLAPHLLDRMGAERQGTARVKGKGSVGNLRIVTTLRASLQAQVHAIVGRRAAALRQNGIQNAAALVVGVDSGDVFAYVGNVPASPDSSRENQVDCITAARSTGSVLKPFLYAAMLDCGELLPTMLVPDVPTSIGGFTPQNFDREYQGAVPASMALARSLNVPAVRMLMHYGISRFHHTLQCLGMSTVTRSADNYGISLILGGAEGSLWELTGIYASMARRIHEYFSQREPDHASHALHLPVLAEGEICRVQKSGVPLPFSAGACWNALDAMKEVVRPGEEAGWKEFQSSRRVAWKTGTSFGFRDGWAIGVTPSYAVGVWVGNASGEGRPGLIGILAAAPILFDIFNVLPQTGWFEKPEADLKRIAVCRESGYLPSPDCPHVDTVWTPLSCEHALFCPYHHIVHLSDNGKWRVTNACERVAMMQHKAWFILPPVMESYYRRHNTEYTLLPQMRSGCAPAEEQDNPIGLLYPHAGSKVYIPRELSGEMGRVVFEAAHRSSRQTIFWHLDDEYLGSTTTIHQMAANPVPGIHHLVLVDGEGNRLEKEIEVLCKKEE